MAFRDLEGMIRALQLRLADYFQRLQLAQPAGAMTAYAGASAPEGWLLCDGRAVNRSDYPALFAAIGTTYGPGNGSSTFNVPDARGRVLVSRDAGQSEFDALGEAGGAKTHTLTTAQIPAHKHGFTYGGNPLSSGLSGGNGVNQFVNWYLGNAAFATPAHQLGIDNAGGGQPHNNLQPYLTVNYLIKT